MFILHEIKINDSGQKTDVVIENGLNVVNIPLVKKEPIVCDIPIKHMIIKGNTLYYNVADLKGTNLVGQQFGDLKVIEYLGNKKWHCVCSCGKHKAIAADSLIKGKSTTCGHTNTQIKDISGKVVNNWKVLYYTGKDYRWVCQCTCGCEKVHTFRRDKIIRGEIGNCKNVIDERKPIIKDDKPVFEDFYDYLDNLGINIIKDDTVILKDYSLDIYISNKNIAFELNSNTDKKGRTYYINKTLACLEKGIRLIHIFEYEWKDLIHKEKLKNFIKSALDIDQKTIYARKTEVRTVNKVIVNEFVNNYHLQGNVQAYNTAYGLYYNNELIEVMTFGIPRFNKYFDTELIRLCTKTGYRVIGGASKLFTYYTRKHPTESIISYCNLSKFSGLTYEKIGMTFLERSSPSYVYVKGSEVLSRNKCMKHKLLEKGWGTYSQTELSIMTNQGYSRIFDCGNNVYTYNQD